MPLITTSYPNLSGGVSQQPSSQRLLTQCEEQENALPLIVGGLIKRPPTEHVDELKTTGGASIDMRNHFTHLVQRDSTERFFVSVNDDGDVLVHDVDGTPRTVVQDSLSRTYLGYRTAGSEEGPKTVVRAVTIADVTFLLNNQYPVSMSSSLSSGGTTWNHEALVWIKSSGYGIKASVDINDGSNHTITFEHEPEAKPVDDNLTKAGLRIWNGFGEDINIKVTDWAIRFEKSSNNNELETYRFFQSQTDNDSETNDPPIAPMQTLSGIMAYLNENSNIQCVLEGQGAELCSNLNTGTFAVADGGIIILNTTSDPSQYHYPTNYPATSDVAASLANGTVPPTDCTVTTNGINGITGIAGSHSGSVVWVGSNDDFQITSEDSFGQQGMSVIKDEVQDFSELPPVAPNGMVILIKGNPESEIDDYYVKFITNGGGSFGEGLWVETVQPGIKYTWQYNTLPQILVRQADNTFHVKPANGSAPGSNDDGSVTWSNFKFEDRSAGSELTNPEPSFIDTPISDISYFKNRLAFLSGENCTLSEAGELFNFWRITVTQLLDTSPVDVGVGGTEINKLERAVPFSNRLILFSERSQFALQGEGILSPKTASIFQVTNFDVTASATPVSHGNTMFFPFKRGSFSGIREFYKTGETDINYDAIESTGAVPKYIEGKVERMSVSTLEDLLVVKSDKSPGGGSEKASTLYVYKFFKTERGRVQSAWFKFILDNCEVLDTHFILNHLYLIVEREGKTYLERMNVQSGLVDTNKEYTTHLDRRISWEAGADGNVIDLPTDYEIEAGDDIRVVSRDGEVMTIESNTSTSITLKESFENKDIFYIGVPYTMRYEITSPILKRPKEGGGYESMTTGRHQLRYMTVVFDETAYFNVRVTPKIGGSYSDPVDYPFSGRFLSSGGFLGNVPSETGDFRFPVFSQSDSIKIEILNDSPLPSNIQSLEFEAQYTSRSQRM